MFKKLINFLVFLAFGLYSVVVVYGVEYNVETGNELQSAFDKANPGDKIFLNINVSISPNITGPFFIRRNGTADNPILFKMTSFTGYITKIGGYALILNGNHWNIEQLRITTPHEGLIITGDFNRLHDPVIKAYNGIRMSGSYNILQNGHFETTKNGILLDGLGQASHNFINGRFLSSSGSYGGIIISKGNNNTISGCYLSSFEGDSPFDIWVEGRASNSLIENTIFDRNTNKYEWRNWVILHGTNCTIRNNTGVKNNGNAFLLTNTARNTFFESNQININGSSNSSLQKYCIYGDPVTHNGNTFISLDNQCNGGQMTNLNMNDFTTAITTEISETSRTTTENPEVSTEMTLETSRTTTKTTSTTENPEASTVDPGPGQCEPKSWTNTTTTTEVLEPPGNCQDMVLIVTKTLVTTTTLQNIN